MHIYIYIYVYVYIYIYIYIYIERVACWSIDPRIREQVRIHIIYHFIISIPPRDPSPHQDSAGTQPPVAHLSLYKILFHFIALLLEYLPFTRPPPATPTLMQYYCTAIAQFTPRHRPSHCMPCTIQYWGWQYLAKAKAHRRRLRHTAAGRINSLSRSIPAQPPRSSVLAFTRYSFTSRLLCTNQPSFHSPGPPAFATMVQYYCTVIGQYTTPRPTSLLYDMHHTILVITILC